jgi:hypothetical protein
LSFPGSRLKDLRYDFAAFDSSPAFRYPSPRLSQVFPESGKYSVFSRKTRMAVRQHLEVLGLLGPRDHRHPGLTDAEALGDSGHELET